ncbi:MAG: hypothetical protein ABTQ29_07680 [Siculibacillus sp.]
MLAVAVAVGFALDVGLTASPLFAGLDILFYRGLAIAAVSAMVVAGVVALAGRWARGIDAATVIAAGALVLAVDVTFLIVMPVTVDRSVSVFLLGEIERAEVEASGLDAAGLEARFVARYLGEMRQIDRRIREQTTSGNIETRDGVIHLTDQGRRFMATARVVARLWGTDPAFVAPPRTPR